MVHLRRSDLDPDVWISFFAVYVQRQATGVDVRRRGQCGRLELDQDPSRHLLPSFLDQSRTAGGRVQRKRRRGFALGGLARGSCRHDDAGRRAMEGILGQQDVHDGRVALVLHQPTSVGQELALERRRSLVRSMAAGRPDTTRSSRGICLLPSFFSTRH